MATPGWGDAPGVDRINEFVAIRGLQVLAWSLLASVREGTHLRASTARRLEWLRSHSWSARRGRMLAKLELVADDLLAVVGLDVAGDTVDLTLVEPPCALVARSGPKR